MPAVRRPKTDLVEVFGHAPDDLSPTARSLWSLAACPFTNQACSKTNHDRSITYGTCTVTASGKPCIVCPNRLYESDYAALRRVSHEAFGDAAFLMFDRYVPRRAESGPFVVPLGHNSGREVKLSGQMSMDWVLALVHRGKLQAYVGVEVQSIDTTGNYRDTWYGYRNLLHGVAATIPESEHGLNWANVHKRLIPQIIRKGLVYSRSTLVQHGLYFIVPEVVYQKFEGVIGADIKADHADGPGTLTVHTYGLSSAGPHGAMRHLVRNRCLKLSLDDFAQRFVDGPNLPPSADLDNVVRTSLGCR